MLAAHGSTIGDMVAGLDPANDEALTVGSADLADALFIFSYRLPLAPISAFGASETEQ